MAEWVLVADANAERGRRIAAACRALSLEVRVVTHGAAALELALAEKPCAMVAQIELPLIDGARLAEILHANPHTCTMGILFVGDGDGGGRRTSGRVIPGHADPDTIARFTQAMLQKRRPEPLATAAGGDAPGVEGKLAQISLAELLELFHVNRKTGAIELRQGGGRRAEGGCVWLRDGDVIQARTGGVEGEKALFRLLGWRRGGFAFREEEPGEAAAIDRPTRALLREAQRQAEEWERLGSELPAPQTRVALRVSRASLPNVLHPLTQEVLLVLEFSTTVQEVLDRVGFPDYQVLRTLQMLARRGMVELREASSGPERPAGGLFAPAGVARLRDWLDQGRPREAGSVDAKVAVLASERDARDAFAALVGRLPGVETIGGAGPGDPPGIRPMLRIPVDDEVAIEFFDVPVGTRFAPVWPLAVHGALATMFVHGGGTAASVEALRPAIEAVGGRPGARVFHVLLEGKEGGGIQGLCEQLALFDDRGVLALCPERPEPAAKRLREGFARLLLP